MKTLRATILLAMMIAFTAMSSCKKDDTNNAASGKATVEASLYGFDSTNGAAFKSTAAGIVQAGNLWTLTAIKDGSNESITIILPNVTGTGTFKLDQGNADGNGAIMTKDYTKPSDATLNYSTDLTSANGMIGGGEVKITALTANSAEGTFYIVAHNSVGRAAFVENGTFKGTLVKK